MSAEEPTFADRTEIIAEVATILGVEVAVAGRIAEAFETYISRPLAEKLRELTVTDLARRNPYVYAILGADTVGEWARRVFSDKQVSNLEGLVGNWLEEVAVIVSGGFKPGSGVDLQMEREVGPDKVVDLYAIQSTLNTKNAAGGRGDKRALNDAAAVLRSHRRHVDLYIGFLFGRKRTTTKDGIKRLSSTEFWERISGDSDFGDKLLTACRVLRRLSESTARTELERLELESVDRFGDPTGRIDPDKLLRLV